MTVRGFTTAETLPDGTRHIRWFPSPPPPAEDQGSDATRMDAARNRAKSRKSKATFDKRTRDAMTALGTPYQFDDYHWQVRDGARVVLDLWTNNKGRVAWRWPDGGTIDRKSTRLNSSH